ncbi:telomere zinc finger-associated protein-like [Palaemon carinicauda]|uniref:telomere zinc finger-associated protein-like n=1 Tax=Palaemon carinicauda TaxID=392227 RepID=UPI0035B57C87
MNEYIELKWNSHSSTFTESLGSLRDQQIYTDVTISCGDQFYPAHRLVLSSCSSFFAKTLKMTDCKNPVLLLYGIDQFILEYLLMFMYDGQVTVTKHDLPNFIRAAQWLGLKGLETVPNNQDKLNGRHHQPELPDGESESTTYFQTWKKLLSPLASSMGQTSSLDELTTVLRQLVGRIESERTIENLVVSNVTSLSVREENEPRFLGAGSNAENDYPSEAMIKCEQPDISMGEDENHMLSSTYRSLDMGNSNLDCYDSSDSDNDFEGWENSPGNYRNKLKDLQLHINQNGIHDYDVMQPASSPELSPCNTSKDEDDSEVLSKRKRPLRCKQCKIVFRIREDLAEHLRNHGHNFCYLCSKGFLSTKRYHMHMRIHDEGSLLFCTECHFTTHSKRGLAIHWSAMHGDDQPTDQYDSKLPDSVSLLTCDLCGFRSNHSRGFKRHVTCMHSRKRWRDSKGHQDDETSFYNCSMCDFSSNCQTGLKTHMTRKHIKDAPNDSVVEEPVTDVVQEGDTLTTYHCSMCNFSSIHKRGFKKHMSCVHYKFDISVDSQIENNLSGVNDDSSKRSLRSCSREHRCKNCNRSFENLRMLRKHEIIACGRYECRYCKMKYGASERAEYLTHLQKHRGNVASYNCKFCPYVTNRRSSLADHMCRHTGVYRFCCQWCTFKCIRQNRLQAHVYRCHRNELREDERDSRSGESSGNETEFFELTNESEMLEKENKLEHSESVIEPEHSETEIEPKRRKETGIKSEDLKMGFVSEHSETGIESGNLDTGNKSEHVAKGSVSEKAGPFVYMKKWCPE